MKDIKVTVLMGIYYKDPPAHLNDSIESVLNQTFSDLEFLIVLDGSTTNELRKIVDKYASLDSRIKLLTLENKVNFPTVLNIGIENASGDMIARMDPDDICHKRRIEKQFKFLNKNKKVDFIGSNAEEIDENSQHLYFKTMPESQKDIEKLQTYRDAFIHPSVMFRSNFFEKYGKYSELDEHKPFEDTELWSRAIYKGANGFNIQENLIKFRLDKTFFERRGDLNYGKKEFKIRFKYLINKKLSLFFIILQIGVFILRICPRRLKRYLYLTLR
jgi:glycosyltransferase involved in cell wall biosynthesis